MDPCGGYYFDASTIEEIRDLAHEIMSTIANAEVRYSEAKRLMAESESE